MYNFESNTIYKAYHRKDDKEYFCFLIKQRNDLFVDAITNKIFKLEDLSTIICQPCNLQLINFIKKLYFKNKTEDAFLVKDYIETESILPYSILIRFFDLKYSDFFETENDKDTLEKVIKKCIRYIKRYVDLDILKQYEEQLYKFKNISDIISFYPEEIKSIKSIFWSEVFNGNYTHKNVLYNVKLEKVKFFNELGLDWNLLFNVDKNNQDKRNKCKNNFVNLKETYLNDLAKEFKDKITEIIQERLTDAKNSLENETKYANETNDEDLIREVKIITNMILELENNIFEQIQNLNVDVDLFEFWPELLYPVPEIIKEKFHSNKKLEMLYEINDWFNQYD